MKPYYEHGGITIYHGDCREIAFDVMGRPDVIVTDPPYGLSRPGSSEGRMGQGMRSLDFFPNDSAEQGLGHARFLFEMSVQSGARSVYLWLAHRQFAEAVPLFEGSGWRTRFLVWSRKHPVPSPPGAGWPSGATLCLLATLKGSFWNPRPGLQPRSNVLVADSYRSGVPGKNGHPTQMNPALVETPIACSCPDDGLVFDPFSGSGTTLVAARDLGRKAIGVEIEERYCEIAAKRLAQEVLPFG